jgi:hypothetical protein
MPSREEILNDCKGSRSNRTAIVGTTEVFTLKCVLDDGTVLRSDEAKSCRIFYDPRVDGGWTSYQRPADWDDSRVSRETVRRYYEQERCDD